MKLNKSESGNVAFIAIAVIVGVFVGFAVGKMMNNDDTNKSSSAPPTSMTKAADLRSNLVTLGVEHMSLTNTAVDDALDGSPAAAESAKALYTNGNNIGAAVGSVYGKEAETTFNSVWKLHLDEFVKYAVADKSGDEAAKKAALDTIEAQYTKPLAQFLAKANPNIDEKTLETALGDHVQMTAAMFDDHVQGKYADEYAELQTANKHMESIMSSLAGAIVKQYPAKFQN